MSVTEGLLRAEYGDSEVVMEDIVPAIEPNSYLISQLNEVVFKLRAFMESSEGDIGLGVEMGMQRAADMIETVLNRHGQSGE